MMRKFGIKYSLLHPQSGDVRDAFIKVKTMPDWLAVLDLHYAEDRPGQYPSPEALKRHTNCEPAGNAV